MINPNSSLGEATSVSSSNVGEAVSFSIENSADAFDALSNGLYNEKILAIIREYACNAFDSHTEAGNPDRPFEVHLPTSFEPTFSITDYGIGLDDERIHKLFTTYFSSSKTKSNEVTGMFGLGSKAAFSYTKGFTVTSKFNGKARHYSCHVGPRRVPEVVLLSEMDTTDANGLKIELPVHQKDFDEFYNKAAVALEFMHPRPTVNRGLIPRQEEYVIKTDTWGIRKNPHTPQTSTIRAIQGRVAYNIGNIDTSKMTPAQQRILGMPIDLFFHIGAVSVTTSRERLSNDERTVENILKAVDDVYTQLVDEIKAKINSCVSYYEARLVLYGMSNSAMKEIVDQARKNGELYGEYTNFVLEDEKDLVINELEYKHTMITKFEHNSRSGRRASKTLLFTRRSDEQRKAIFDTIKDKTISKDVYRVSFSPRPDVTFVLNDLRVAGERYVHYLLQVARRDALKTAYVIGISGNKNDQAKMTKEANRILKELKNPKVVLMSELQKEYGKFVDIKRPTNYVKRERKNIVQLSLTPKGRAWGKDTFNWYKNWVRAEESAIPGNSVKKYYLLLENYKPVGGIFETQDCEALVGTVNDAIKSELFDLSADISIFGLKKNSKLIGHPDWVEFSSYLHETFKREFTPQVQERLTLVGSEAEDIPAEKFWPIVIETPQIAEDSPAEIFAKSVISLIVAKDVPANLAIHRLYHRFRNQGIVNKIDRLPILVACETMLENYPMIKLSGFDAIHRNGWVGNKYFSGVDPKKGKIFLDYIAAMDSNAKMSFLTAQKQALLNNVTTLVLEEVA